MPRKLPAGLPLALLIALAPCTPSRSPDTRPSITTMAVATLVGGPVSLAGVRFGGPSAGRSVVVQEASQATLRIASTDPLVQSWLDQRITFNLPPATTSGTLVVETPAGRSGSVTLDVYRYDTFAVPTSPGTNASPLAVAVDATGRVWLNQEFHLDSLPLAVLQPNATALTLVHAPTLRGPGPFATRIGGPDQSTHISELGEDVVVDPKGRVWASEGGGLLYDGQLPNHSRVVGYDPAAPEGDRLRIYNLPGDHNEVTGLAWDSAEGRLWLAQGGLQSGPRLLSFDPERTPFDNSFDFSRPLDAVADGYRIYALPAQAAYPAHLLVEPDGTVWFSAYIGNAIGRLDPKSGAVILLPLPKPTSTDPAARAFGTEGPWDILASPGGGLAFNTQFEDTLSRLDAAHMSNLASCQRLDHSGRNPCLRTISVPGDLSNELVHSAAFDAAGRLWFSQHANGTSAGASPSIGFVDPGWRSAVMLPALPNLAGDASGTASNDGIAIDPRTQDVWFAEYFRHRVSRLHRV